MFIPSARGWGKRCHGNRCPPEAGVGLGGRAYLAQEVRVKIQRGLPRWLCPFSQLPPTPDSSSRPVLSSQEPFIFLGFNEDLRELLIMCVLHLSIVTVFELKLEELLSVRIHSITCSTSCQSDPIITSHSFWKTLLPTGEGLKWELLLSGTL